jgi:peroxiredoxin
MHEMITTARNAAAMVEGRRFIDFTLPDQNGTDHTLSELIKGKTAVLELWASWCRSCRVTAKSLKPLYEKYGKYGFTVVGVAREYRDTEKWTKALAADDYPWTNMVALENNHNIWTQYGSPDAAGRTLLINSDGIIIRIDPTAKEVEEYLRDICSNN